MVSFVFTWQLLGKDSHDIDIAIDNMLGKQFCEKVNEYRAIIGEETSKMHIILRHACLSNPISLGQSIEFSAHMI